MRSTPPRIRYCPGCSGVYPVPGAGQQHDLNPRGRSPAAERPPVDVDDRGKGASPASGGEATHVSIGPPGPTTSSLVIFGWANCLPTRSEPGVGVNLRLGSAVAAGFRGAIAVELDRHHLHGPAAQRAQHHHPPGLGPGATARAWVVRSSSGPGSLRGAAVGPATGRPLSGSIVHRRGRLRPRSVTVATMVCSSCQAGPIRERDRPAMQIGVTPVADRSIQIGVHVHGAGGSGGG